MRLVLAAAAVILALLACGAAAGGQRPRALLPTEALSPLFEAALEATEEAAYNSLFQAVTVTGRGHTVEEGRAPSRPVRWRWNVGLRGARSSSARLAWAPEDCVGTRRRGRLFARRPIRRASHRTAKSVT